jgi:RNA polymerase sigma-70 factor, ECF subfamily
MMTFAPWRRRADAPAVPQAPSPAQQQALQRLAAGETGALEPLYRAEAGPVYRYALALCGNPAWAADATQEAFVALATRPHTFDPERGTLGAWLAGIARHALAAQWRDLQRHAPLPEPDDTPAPGDAAEAASPESLLVQVQDGAAVWAALRQLPAVFREAVVLVDLQERPYAEAAAIAGVELNTLRTRLHRARLKLAALLGGAAA